MDKIACNLAVDSEVETNEDKLRKLLFEEEFFPEYWKTMLSGVFAYVDVRSGSDNRSRSIAKEMERLGATIVPNFSKKVTHVIFKDGSKAVYDKAKKLGIPVLSYLWVCACKDNGECVPVDGFPSISSQDYDSPFFKQRRVKSMQPKDPEEELRAVERKLERKRKKMAKTKTTEHEDIQTSDMLLSPIKERPLKDPIDSIIACSPMIQEKIFNDLASGKTYQEIFTLKEEAEDDFDAFVDTPLAIRFIAKNYFSPHGPPPPSIRRMLEEISSPRASNSNGSQSEKKDVSSKCNFKPESIVNSPLVRVKNLGSGPILRGSQSERKSASLKCNFQPDAIDNSPSVIQDVGSSPNLKRSRSERKTVSSEGDSQPGAIINSPLARVQNVGSKRKKSYSAIAVSKRIRVGDENIEREGVPRRKLLFRQQQSCLMPEDVLRPKSPGNSPMKMGRNHPCFSQGMGVKRNEVEQDSGSPDLVVPRLSPRRDSLADFTPGFKKSNQGKESKAKLNTKKSLSFICTSMHASDICLVEKAVQDLKEARMKKRIDGTTTHVVCGTSRRTLNLIRGLIRGLRLVSFQWILDSMRENRWLDENDYPVERFSKIATIYRENKFNLFKELDSVYISPKSEIPCADLREFLKYGGGKLVDFPEKAELIIGCRQFNVRTICVTSTWVLDSIEKGCTLPFADYVFAD